MIKIYTYSHNRPDFIEPQYNSIKKTYDWIEVFVCADKITQDAAEIAETKEPESLNPLSRFLKWMDK